MRDTSGSPRLLTSFLPCISMILNELSPSRRTIVKLYKELRESDRRSRYYIVTKICNELGYVVDSNGSNSFVLKVLREYYDKNE